MFDSIAHDIPYQTIIDHCDVRLVVKRLDLVHPYISGNKFYKLKYNLLNARSQGQDTLLTFGGAFSNHIAATAYAAHYFGFKSIGMIRGEELASRPLNHTLQTARDLGMQLEFVSREQYREKDQSNFLSRLHQQYPHACILPEGGTNHLAIQGCKEILNEHDRQTYHVICCAVGTGGTLTGLIEASQPEQKILGFSALKGDFLKQQVSRLTHKTHWDILDHYCFGGYAKIPPALREFIEKFEQQYALPLEPVYTAKMLFGIFDLIQKGYFPIGSQILAIHSGGLQGKNAFP